MSKCRSCGADVVWALTETGKRLMPLDGVDQGGFTGLQPYDDGNIVVTGSAAGRYGPMPVVAYVTAADGGKYKSHFATCPHADEHRRK